jgi:hypothetical protein
MTRAALETGLRLSSHVQSTRDSAETALTAPRPTRALCHLRPHQCAERLDAQKSPCNTTDIVSNGPMSPHCERIGGTCALNCLGPPLSFAALCIATGSQCFCGRFSDCVILPEELHPWADVDAAAINARFSLK